MKNTEIAIVGMACVYPDARTPIELWENALAQRRAFRRIPPERLRLEDYFSTDRSAPDSTYATEAALIDGYEFDRVRFRVAGSTFRSADMVHWLALDVASQALEDAGFPEGKGLPRETTGILLGNTLTGEFSRANVMRLRWPYVRRVVEARLIAEGFKPPQRRAFLEELEAQYKEPFPPIGEETLAGGLSNTIAGRICNHFNLKGGGYTVDGACASSLLAVANACSALIAGDLDVALAGGVDLSLDPFELVGFAKAGALALEEMRVYDTQSTGFWPGEGCGFVVLMPHETAVAQHRHIYAVIRGWGISSDGSGSITRPEVEGQLLALRRSYRRAGFGIETVTYFEGHGTGTSVGDTTELQTLLRARREAAPNVLPAVIGTIKANIGHTKAAAGIAGLIKATMALHTQILPPTTGCENIHPVLADEGEHKQPSLQVLREGKRWPPDYPLRAGISAMGFGGINTHIVLEGGNTERRVTLNAHEQSLLSSAQDAELFLLCAQEIDDLRHQVDNLLTFAARLSRSEVADLAAELESNLGDAPIRAAIVAKSPAELASRLQILRTWLTMEVQTQLDPHAGVFLGKGDTAPRLAFLFPGQGAPVRLDGSAWGRRFHFVQELYNLSPLPAESDDVTTLVAQPAIVTASLAGLGLLDALGLTADVAIGHSLGELTALHWAFALNDEALRRIATVRGKVMAELESPTGAMASISAGPTEVEDLLKARVPPDGGPVVIAGLNSPRQTVISGEAEAVRAIVARAQGSGLKAVFLPVSHAFHSPLVVAAALPLAEHLAFEDFGALQRTVVSTVTGGPLAPDADVRALLSRQVTEPVRFMEAITAAVKASGGVDLFIEVGPGQVLSGLIPDLVETPVVALDACGRSLSGLLQAVGAAFALGAPVNRKVLFADRFTRPFHLNWHPRFFVNPCELAPTPENAVLACESTKGKEGVESTKKLRGLPKKKEESEEVFSTNQGNKDISHPSPITDYPSTIDLVRQLVAFRAELPLSAVKDDDRLLSDLHLNSISVGQLVTSASRHLGLPPPVAPTEYADATVTEVAQALEERRQTDSETLIDARVQFPSGVDTWIRPFTVELVERPLPNLGPPKDVGTWRVIAPADYPSADALREAFNRLEHGNGVVVCLPASLYSTSPAPFLGGTEGGPQPDERHLNLLLEGARAVLKEGTFNRFVLVQHGGGGAAFARTLYLEALDYPTLQNTSFSVCVVDVPPDHPKATEWVIAEAMAAAGYTEAHYDSAGKRREPVLQLLDIACEAVQSNTPTELPLGADDVLLVTGGGKGITAECAFSLARKTDVRLALLGRSQPDADAELAANLDRLTAANVNFRYLPADVTNAEAVQSAVHKAEAELGPITAILHGAGANVPQLLSTLDEAAFLRTLAPKVQGFQNVLAAVNPEHLRLFVTFGSIIARTGMRGEADYALANEWLIRLTEQFQADHPDCICLAVEWSVWSGIGMGERMGSIDALVQQGITAITPDEGIQMLHRLLVWKSAFQSADDNQQLSNVNLPVSVVVTGRFGEAPTLKMDAPDLPFLRFLEQPRVFYPELELVVDAELSIGTDVYLEDHMFQGERLFPAVMGLEAMAQVAMALAGTSEPPIFEEVQFTRPVVVPQDVPVTIRLAALVREQDRIEVVLRSEETAFQVDHFRGVCQFQSPSFLNPMRGSEQEESLPPVRIDPRRDLYGHLLFQGNRFQRLRGYQRLMATECIAEVAPEPNSGELGDAKPWFSRYLPQTLILGDPAVRDATIHAIQVCVPHATLLPIGVERLVPNTTQTPEPKFVHARERLREGDIFTYDVEVKDKDGQLLEQWIGLRLKMVAGATKQEPWVEPLLGPYIERRVQKLVPSSDVAVVVDRAASAERPLRSDQAIQRVLGKAVPVWRRPDGKPEVEGDCEVSVAHAGELTLAVAGRGPIGCDVEPVVERPSAVWRDLLGPDRFALAGIIARETGEDEATAATRVWAASECLKKAGVQREAPLQLHSSTEEGWVLLATGQLITATFVASVRGTPEPLVLAVTQINK